MLPNLARLLRVFLPFLLVATATALFLRSCGDEPRVDNQLQTAEAESQAASVRAAPVVARAAAARAAVKPVISRAESLHARVRIAQAGQLLVNDGPSATGTLVPVPPLVTEQIQADSAAISALSLALAWDARAAEATDSRIAAEAKVNDAARLTIAAMERERSPRCGRRCGMLLGAASVVALAVTVDQTRRLLH